MAGVTAAVAVAVASAMKSSEFAYKDGEMGPSAVGRTIEESLMIAGMDMSMSMSQEAEEA